jgi:hypothetical protein
VRTSEWGYISPESCAGVREGSVEGRGVVAILHSGCEANTRDQDVSQCRRADSYDVNQDDIGRAFVGEFLHGKVGMLQMRVPQMFRTGIVRTQAENQVIDFGGERGTRTLASAL